jgi:hypothetical protein
VLAGSPAGGTFGDLAADDGSLFSVVSGFLTAPSWYASFAGVPAEAANLRVDYVGVASRTCTLTVAIYDWSTAAWTTLRQQSIGTGGVTMDDLVPPGAAAGYRSPGGEVRVRVTCSVFTFASYSSSGDLLTLTYDA